MSDLTWWEFDVFPTSSGVCSQVLCIHARVMGPRIGCHSNNKEICNIQKMVRNNEDTTAQFVIQVASLFKFTNKIQTFLSVSCSVFNCLSASNINYFVHPIIIHIHVISRVHSIFSISPLNSTCATYSFTFTCLSELRHQ